MLLKRKIRLPRAILIDSVRLYRASLRPLLRVLAILLIPQATLTSIGVWASFGWADDYFGMAFGVMYFFLSLWTTISIAYVLHSALGRQEISLPRIFTQTARAFFPFFALAFIIYFVLSMFIPALLVFLFSLTYLESWAWNVIAFLWVLGALGLSVYFLIKFSLAGYFLLFESESIGMALKKSGKIVSMHFWDVALREITGGFFIIVGIVLVTMIVTATAGAFMGDWLSGFQSLEFEPWWAMLIRNIIGTLSIPLFVSLTLIIYADLVGLKKHV